jgi:hypothetical protein
VEIVTLLLFVGAVWVTCAVYLFAWNLRIGGHEHTDRLAFLPLEDNWQDPKAHERTPSAPSDREGKAEST